ncbi:uncharacterized protein HHUB_2393 [Halobacterium hubeiense]|uniref:Uncharacterized protein n=1 Tax=Halobacterium hubeiense TaxID=1407499 RepID=A0A0U5H378_9EURY|nr:uncharacterized protein HHUB_2393 [Halobacterium hubeiense]
MLVLSQTFPSWIRLCGEPVTATRRVTKYTKPEHEGLID